MSGIVLRGDWLRLRRAGSRVWVRERPHEFIWRTTADLTVDEIRSIEIQPLRLELNRRRRARVRRGSTRVVRPAITRVVIQHGTADEPLSVQLKETEATVAAAFADLGDLVSSPAIIDLVAEHASDDAIDDAIEPDEATDRISWHPGPEAEATPRPGRSARVEHDPDALVAVAEDLGADLARDVSFKLELGADPQVVERWLRHQKDGAAHPSGSSTNGDELFPADETDPAAQPDGAWVRKRRKKRIGRHGSGHPR